MRMRINVSPPIKLYIANKTVLGVSQFPVMVVRGRDGELVLLDVVVYCARTGIGSLLLPLPLACALDTPSWSKYYILTHLIYIITLSEKSIFFFINYVSTA